MRTARGFTLVELLVVIAIIGIMGTIALVSLNRSNYRLAVDNWTAINRDAIATASRRAVSKRTPFMVVFTPTTVQWCEVPPTGWGTPPGYVDATTTCPTTVVPGYEWSAPVNAGSHGATTIQWYPAADIITAAGTYAAPPRNTLSTVTAYVGRNGVFSTNMKDALTAGGLPDPTKATGLTLYTQARSADQAHVYNKRLVVYGLTGKTRIFEDH